MHAAEFNWRIPEGWIAMDRTPGESFFYQKIKQNTSPYLQPSFLSFDNHTYTEINVHLHTN